MGALITSWRLRSRGITHAMTLRDMSHAFGTSQWDQLDETAFLHPRECDCALCQQRYDNALFWKLWKALSQFDLHRGTRWGTHLLPELSQ
eukprot:919383-Pyramimonas_sp.AAC.1